MFMEYKGFILFCLGGWKDSTLGVMIDSKLTY